MTTLAQRVARAVLPAVIRRPLATAVYVSIDRIRGIARRMRSMTSTGAPVRLTPRGVWRHVVLGASNAAAALQGRASSMVRLWLVRHLPLLAARAPLGVVDRGRLVVLRRVLAHLDERFSRQFRGLLASALPPARRSSGRPLIMAAIGTLGPGGAERQLVNTLTGIKAAFDVDVEVAVMYLDEEWQRFYLPTLEAAGVRVTPVPRDGGPPLAEVAHPAAVRLATAVDRHLSAALGHVGNFARLFLERQPDVAHLWLDEVNVKAGLAAVLVGVGHIVLGMRSVNPSHFVFYQPYMKAGYQALLECSHVRALNNSDAGADDYSRWLGLPPGRIAVLRNGVDFDKINASAHAGSAYRRSHGIPPDVFVMGGVMRFSEEKRPLLWLEVAALVALRHPMVHFLLVGDGVQRPEVEARIVASSLNGRVHLAGHEQKPYDSIAAMNVLFLSSVFEGSPNVLIEAQALGVPVVLTPAGGAVETVDHGKTGWIAASGQAREAANLVCALVQEPAVAAAASRLAPAFVRNRYGMSRMVTETAAAYGGLPPRVDDSTRL